MERIFRKLAIVVAVLLVLGFVANILIDNPYTHRLLRAAINEKVSEYTHLVLDFKAIKAAAVPPGIDLYGVRVTAEHAPQNDLLNASHVKVRVSLWSLFLGQPRLGSIEVSNLQLVWPPAYGFPGFLRPERVSKAPTDQNFTWPLEFDIPVDQIVLNNANVYMEFPLSEAVPMAPEYLVMAMVGLDLDFDYQDRRNASAHISLGAANVSIGARSMLEDTALNAAIELHNDELSVVGLQIDGERIKAEGDSQFLLHTRSLTPRILEQIEIKSDLSFDADLSILGSYLDLAETRGRTRGDAKINAMVPIESTTEALFEVSGQGRVEDGYLSGFKLFDSATKFRITSDALELSDVMVMIGETIYGKASGSIQFDNTIAYDFAIQPDQLRLNDLLTALTVSFDTLDAGITSDNLQLSGTGDPFSMRVKATALFDEFTLPATPYDTSKFPLSPACALDVNLIITGDYLDINDSKGTCYRKPPPRPISAGLTAAPAGARDASPLGLDGRIWFDETRGLDLKVGSSSLQLGLAEYFAQTKMAGNTDLQVKVHGAYTDVQVAMTIAGTEVTIADVSLGRVEGNVRVKDDLIGWADVGVFPGQQGQLNLPRGSLQLNDALSFTTQILVTNLSAQTLRNSVSNLVAELPLEIDVTSIEGEISGPLLYPGAWLGDLGIEFGEGRYAEALLFTSVLGRLESSAKGWQTSDLSVELDSLRVGIDISHRRAFPFLLTEAKAATDAWAAIGLHPDDTFSAAITTQDNVATENLSPEEANHLGRLPFVGEAIRTAEIEGTLEFSGKFKGTTSAMQGTFDGRIARPSVLGSKLSGIDFRGFVADSKIDLMVSHSGNSLEGRISVDVAAAGIPYEWYFNFNRMDLRAFGTDIFHQDPRNYAYLTADWRMTGQLENWWGSTGELALQDIRAQYVQDIGSQTKTIQLKQESPSRLLFTKDAWVFENNEELVLTGRYFDIRMALPDSRPPENLGFRLTTVVDVEVARAFLQDVDSASGKLRVVAEVTGPVEDPNFSLEITDLKQNPFIASTWQPVKLGFADLRPPLTNIRMRAIVQDGRLFLDSFTANKGNGTVTANGTLNLTDDSTLASRLDINLNEATIVYPVAVLKSFESQVSGNVFISGSGIPYTVGGDIKVTRARAVQEIDIRDQVLEAFRRQSFSTALVNENPSVFFDINVTADETINIHNRNLQANLSAEIQLKGSNVQPIVGGQIEINRGKFIYNRDFTITRGLATFDDPVKPDPSLDILAFSDISTYRVYIAVSGKVFEPVIEFSVDPPTTEQGTPITKEEILVLISRGSLPESSQLGGEITSAATSEALNLIMGQFEEPVEKLFDLTGQNVVRNVYIDTYPSENGPIARLNMPLDLGENFDVVVRLDETATKYSVEYPIHDSITLSGTIEDLHDVSEKTETKDPFNAAANLKFRFSFE